MMPLSSLGERRKNVSLTRLEPERQVESEPMPERDWRSYRKPPEQIIYSDTGHGYVKQYQKKPRSFTERRPQPGVFANDVGVYYGLSSFKPESRVVAPISESELEWESQYREFKLWRMITTSDLSQIEKEQLLVQVFPWTQEAFTQAHSEAESHKFYQSLGYPQFGGKYQPFTVPSGAKIKSIVESGEGLDITFESLTPTVSTKEFKLPKTLDPHGTLSEQFINTTWVTTETKASVIKPSSSLSKSLYDITYGESLNIDYGKGSIGSTAFRPFERVAGIASNFESLVFGMVDIFKPQTVIGTHKVIGTPERTPLMLEEGFGEMSEGYMQGAFLGSILVSEMINQTMISPLISGVGSEIGQAFRGSRLEHAIYNWSRPEIVNKVDFNTAWKEGANPFMSGYEEDIGLLSKLKAWTYQKLSPAPMIVSQPTEVLGQGVNLNPKMVYASDYSFEFATTARSAGFGRTAMMAEPVVAEGLKETSMTLAYMPLSFTKSHWAKPTEAIFNKLVNSKSGSLLVERPSVEFDQSINLMKDVGTQAVKTSIKTIPLAISFGVAVSPQLKFFRSKGSSKTFLPALKDVSQPTRLSSETEAFTNPTAKTGLFRSFKTSNILIPKASTRFDQTTSTKQKPISLLRSGLKLDLDLKQDMIQSSKLVDQYQLRLPQLSDEPFKRLSGKRKRKKAKQGIAAWYMVNWPLSKPEDFLKGF